MAPLLLTGATGFLGSAVAARLDALNIAWEPLPTRLEQIEAGSLPHTRVLHCAGAPRRLCAEDWQRSNIDGMARLLAGLRQPARLVFASSRAVYAPADAHSLLSESTPLGPCDGYGLSKLAGETALRESAHTGIHCRLTSLFGQAPRGRCPSLPNIAMQSFREGKGARLVENDFEVDYLLVADAARLMVEIALRAELSEPVINLAGPRRSLHTLIATLAQACAAPLSSIQYDYPRGVVWPCMDTRLLAELFPDFVPTRDQEAANVQSRSSR